MDLTSDMALIEEHYEEGIRLHRAGGFTAAECGEHQAITYAALILLGCDGMTRMGKRCLLEEAAAPQLNHPALDDQQWSVIDTCSRQVENMPD